MLRIRWGYKRRGGAGGAARAILNIGQSSTNRIKTERSGVLSPDEIDRILEERREEFFRELSELREPWNNARPGTSASGYASSVLSPFRTTSIGPVNSPPIYSVNPQTIESPSQKLPPAPEGETEGQKQKTRRKQKTAVASQEDKPKPLILVLGYTYAQSGISSQPALVHFESFIRKQNPDANVFSWETAGKAYWFKYAALGGYIPSIGRSKEHEFMKQFIAITNYLRSVGGKIMFNIEYLDPVEVLVKTPSFPKKDKYTEWEFKWCVGGEMDITTFWESQGGGQTEKIWTPIDPATVEGWSESARKRKDD